MKQRAKTSRKDGRHTRAIILEAAGRVFAEKGYADATSKEICKAAGTNIAAVNYHFGSRDNLYGEVLIEAHKQLIKLEELEQITSMQATPEAKLRELLLHFIKTARTSKQLWGVKVFVREIISPSSLSEGFLVPAILPKVLHARQIIGEVIGHTAKSPHTQRALLLAMLPMFSLILFPTRLREKIVPATAGVPSSLQEDIITYTIAGLKALADK